MCLIGNAIKIPDKYYACKLLLLLYANCSEIIGYCFLCFFIKLYKSLNFAKTYLFSAILFLSKK